MPKQWKILEPLESPCCGDNVEILTDAVNENEYYDDDDARCCSCQKTGIVYAGNDGNPILSMEEAEWKP